MGSGRGEAVTDKTHALAKYMALYEPNTKVIEAAKAHHKREDTEQTDGETDFGIYYAVRDLLAVEGEE